MIAFSDGVPADSSPPEPAPASPPSRSPALLRRNPWGFKSREATSQLRSIQYCPRTKESVAARDHLNLPRGDPRVLPVADRHEEFARKVLDVLQAGGVRAELDDRNETLGYRVRSAETQKIPYILVVGDREQAESTVSVRRRHRKGQQTVGVDEFRSKIEEEIQTRGIS